MHASSYAVIYPSVDPSCISAHFLCQLQDMQSDSRLTNLKPLSSFHYGIITSIVPEVDVSVACVVAEA